MARKKTPSAASTFYKAFKNASEDLIKERQRVADLRTAMQTLLTHHNLVCDAPCHFTKELLVQKLTLS